MQVFDDCFQADLGWNWLFFSAYFVLPYCRVCFVQFLSGVFILMYLLRLFGIDEIDFFLNNQPDALRTFPNLLILQKADTRRRWGGISSGCRSPQIKKKDFEWVIILKVLCYLF